jgi:hypothetical protein
MPISHYQHSRSITETLRTRTQRSTPSFAFSTIETTHCFDARGAQSIGWLYKLYPEFGDLAHS